jgi:hypothetical protein
MSPGYPGVLIWSVVYHGFEPQLVRCAHLEWLMIYHTPDEHTWLTKAHDIPHSR